MKKVLTISIISLLGSGFSTLADSLELKILEGEYWWAGLSSKGYEMPYDASTEVSYDLWGDNKGNQAQPLLLSNKGRFVWSEEPIKFVFKKGFITVTTREGTIDSGKKGSNLAEVFDYVSNKYFPSNSSPTENMPETIVFFVLNGLKTPSPLGDFSNVLTNKKSL